MTDFDYGVPAGDEKQKFIDWPKEGEFTALVDADLIPYKVGFTVDPENYIAGIFKACEAGKVKEYIPGQLPNEAYDELLKTEEFQKVINHITWMVNDWVKGSGADSAILFMTGEHNFRNDIAILRKYKDRDKEKPPFFYEIRKYLFNTYGAVVSKWCEADDEISIHQHRNNLEFYDEEGDLCVSEMSPTIVVSIDKDLRMIPGWHYNPDKAIKDFVTPLGSLEPVWKEREIKKFQEWPLVAGKPVEPTALKALNLSPDTFIRGAKKGQIKYKKVETGTQVTQSLEKLKGSGLKFFYAQILLGDSVDTYPGLPGCGATRVYELLEPLLTERDLFEAVKREYKRKYLKDGESVTLVENYRGGILYLTPYQLMIEQGRLAWMQTFPGEVWRDKTYLPLGTDDSWRDLL